MAGDIFFTDSRAWSSGSAGFLDIISRTICKCRTNEESLVRILANAWQIRCLGINLQDNRDVQIALTERVLEAAKEAIRELSAEPTINREDRRIVSELVATAQEHLIELRGGQT